MTMVYSSLNTKLPCADMDFQDSVLNGILNKGNVYESNILKEYMEEKSLSVKDVLAACCDKLESGEYTCSDSRTSRVSPSTRTCTNCALRNFKDLVYLYRRDIPDSELPGGGVARVIDSLCPAVFV